MEEPEPDEPLEPFECWPTEPPCTEPPGTGLPAGDPVPGVAARPGAIPSATEPEPLGGRQPPSTEACHEVGGTKPLRPEDPAVLLDPCTDDEPPPFVPTELPPAEPCTDAW
ncbi:hypothetical protein FG87_10045, partial [Nocardia vulneris]